MPAFTSPDSRIEAELGHGAYSSVYRARNGNTVCALKVPREKSRWTRWMYREAVALARVRNPGLPLVYEVGEVDGLPYLSMELVEGETLADRLRRGPLSEPYARELATRLAGTLAAVHDAALVHRDVKPRNIVLQRDGRVRLVDFGFATPMELGSGEHDSAGTRGYAAPEQFLLPPRVDARTDLYAVGCVVAECLTGRSPVDRLDRSDDTGSGEIATELEALGVSTGLARIVTHLVAPEPENRYPDARALLADLSLAGDHRAIRGPTAYTSSRRPGPCVGRDGDISRIERATSELSSGKGAVVVVQGVRGSGKSRLLEVAIARTREGRSVVAEKISCMEHDPPLAALRRIFENYLASTRALDGESRSAREDALRAAAADDLQSLATMIAPTLAEFLGSHSAVPPDGVASFPEVVAEMLLRLAKHCGGLALAIDDLQWADPASADVLARVAHRVREAPIVLVFARRSEAAASRSVERILDLDPTRAVSLQLRPLDESALNELVATQLGDPRIPDRLVKWIAPLAAGTPLEALDVLGVLLDSGALRPRHGTWTFDLERAERIPLPSGALHLLSRRVAELPPASRRVIEACAILGATFEDEILARVVGLEVQDVEFGLADARTAGLLESSEKGRHRFVHDSIREMLLAALAPAAKKALHQRVAETLEERGGTDLEHLCAAATHYANGETEKSPERVLRAARAAADASLARFDNESALRYLDIARTAAELAKVRLDATFFRDLGEADLRLGAFDESLAWFEAALARAYGSSERAELLGRIAWVHQMRADPERAWSALGRAFDALGAKMPVESTSSARDTVSLLAQGGLRRLALLGDRATGHTKAETLLLADLHFQNARLGLEYGKPLRVVQSTVHVLERASSGTPTRAEVRARAMYGLVLAAIGRKDAGERELDRAQRIATELAEPAINALCVQLRAMGACFSGDFGRALDLLDECLRNHGHWLELNEFCMLAGSSDLIESVRGRPVQAWSEIERAIERVRRSPTRNTPVFKDYVLYRALAVLAGLDRHQVSDPWLAEELARASERGPSSHGFLRLVSWGAQARTFLEANDYGPDFEGLVAAFDAEAHNPRSVHPVVAEYYIAVAHARANLCLRASPAERTSRLPALRKAHAELRASARFDLFKAHEILIRATLAWLEGRADKARKLLEQAEQLAQAQTCPWVLYGCARLRAYALRADNKRDAARDQARIAETLAREHGAEARARLVLEEFGLSRLANPSPMSRSSSRQRRQLSALLRVVRARGPMAVEQQAAAVLDDLLVELDAHRAALSFEAEAGLGKVSIEKRRVDETWSKLPEPRDAALRASSATNAPPPQAPNGALGVDARRILTAPLFLYDAPVGAVCIERSSDAPPFGPEDRELLTLLSHQVPIALEIARLLGEREQLQTSLRRAQKMEAVGQLAGGIAHDFNNMLTVIQTSLSFLGEGGRLDPRDASEVALIAETTERSALLTRQLLSFSRHQPVPLAEHDVNTIVARMRPLLDRAVGEGVRVDFDLRPGLPLAHTDPASLEQCIMNLAINARDAMPRGGTVTIETSSAVLDDAAVRRGAPNPGDYVCIAVSDTGKGLSADLLDRIFEPFFTTKTLGNGTGLGLTNVYAFMKNSGGHVDVQSELGAGTTFRLYIPEMSEQVDARVSPTPKPLLASPATHTVLVVDDEPNVARTTSRILERGGYRVLVANDPTEALEIVSKLGDAIAVAIIDVVMPGMSGPELGRKFAELRLPARKLYVSGYSPESIPGVDMTAFIQKPFSSIELLERVAELVEPTS